METIVGRTLSVHKQHEVLLKLESAGLNNALAQKIINSKGNVLAARVVQMLQDGESGTPKAHRQARAIMGANFFGIEEAVKYFGVNPSKQQLAYLAEVPFDSEVLKSCKDTHILVAVFPMSTLDIRRKVGTVLFYTFDKNRVFAKDNGEASWQLVRKQPLLDSTDKTWKQQQALLSHDEETPKAQVMAYTIIGHFLQTGERLFENIYVRCSDLDSGGARVFVGHFVAEGLSVGCSWDDTRLVYLGLSTARKQ